MGEVVVHGDGTLLWTLTHAGGFALGFVGFLGNPLAYGSSHFQQAGRGFRPGEPFSGVDYDEGVDAAHEFSVLAQEGCQRPAMIALSS